MIVFLVFAVLLPSLDLGQEKGREGSKLLYFPQVALGGGGITEDGLVIDGWEFSYHVTNLSEQFAIISVSFWIPADVEGSKKELFDVFRKSDDHLFPTRTINPNGGHGWTNSAGIPAWDSRVSSIVATPSFPQFRLGWAKVFIESGGQPQVEPDTSATMKLYSGGKVVSQVGMNAVEAKMVNYVKVFESQIDQQQTGIAVVNPAEVGPISIGYQDQARDIVFRLVQPDGSAGGKEIGKKILHFGPNGHLSVFVRELFPEFAKDSMWIRNGVFTAVLEVSSSIPIPVLALNTRSVDGVGWFMSTLSTTGK